VNNCHYEVPLKQKLKLREDTRPGVVVHAYNPKYLGGLQFEASLGIKCQIPSSQTNQVWWFVSLIPATWEALVKGLQLEDKSETLFEK
jgi:hypothetical protein